MEPRLSEVIISITNRCNLQCAMCQIPLRAAPEMTTPELKGLIEDIVDLHPRSIVFSGGEPLMRPDIGELIAFANQRKVNTCLTSNGTMITDQTAAMLASSGVGVVNVSIEGGQEIHDALRGRGNYKKAVDALENLRRHKIETTIATMVCNLNFGSLSEVMELAARFGVTTVKFQPFSDIFLKDKADAGRFFCGEKTIDDIRGNIEKVIELSRKYRISTNPPAYLRNIPEYLTGMSKYSTNVQCPALWTSCPISSEGDVHLCWVLSEIVIGNCKSKKITEIWGSVAHDRLRKSVLKDKCSGCLMSCYDTQYGTNSIPELIALKARKIKQPQFYKRQYFRAYQYAQYLFKKVFNTLLRLNNPLKKNKKAVSLVLDEIRAAKDFLRKQMH
ncbi:MAG: radical SAM protein [Candidatus Omnitrophota bacterium]|jgi:MoaA/NifB/PqqE/SkfB family radical SAM enzyme